MYDELMDKIEDLERLVTIAICSDRPYCLSHIRCEGCGTHRRIQEVLEEFKDLKQIIERMEMDE